MGRNGTYRPEKTRSHAGILTHHSPVGEVIFFVENIRIVHEYDDHGNHRILVNGRYSDWYTYTSIAKLRHKDNCWFGATTEYWSAEMPRAFMYLV